MMKKTFIIFLLMTTLCCGCMSWQHMETPPGNDPIVQQPEQKDPGEKPSVDPEPTAKELTEEEKRLAEFDELFGNPDSWYQIALYDRYDTVFWLQVRDLFWDGFSNEAPLTEAEYKKMLSHERFAKIENIRRLPMEKMDNILNSVFGVTLDQMRENNAVEDIYGLNSGCGYILRGNPKYIENYKTVSVTEQEDGTLQVTYTLGEENTAYVVTVRPDGEGGYHVLSNLAADGMPSEYSTHFVYDGTQPLSSKNADLSDCVIGSLYYLDMDTGKPYFVCADEISMKAGEEGDIFFVKDEEPTKIYATHLSDFSKHEVIYESQNGPITVRLQHDTWSYKNPILYFVEDNKRFVVLDLVTKEATVLMEQYEINWAYVETVKGGNYTVRVSDLKDMYVYFEGRPNAGDEKRGYLYTVKTGELQEDRRL